MRVLGRFINVKMFLKTSGIVQSLCSKYHPVSLIKRQFRCAGGRRTTPALRGIHGYPQSYIRDSSEAALTLAQQEAIIEFQTRTEAATRNSSCPLLAKRAGGSENRTWTLTKRRMMSSPPSLFLHRNVHTSNRLFKHVVSKSANEVEL